MTTGAGGRVTPRLVIRLATPGDGADLARIYRPAVEEHPTSFEASAPDGAEMGRRVEALRPRFPWLVAVEGESLIGYAYASAHRERAAYAWSVEVSAYVDARAHRHGVARALYTRLLAVLGLQGFQNAYAGIALPNPASIGFHEAMGFREVGTYHRVGFKHGQWRDVRWYERAIGAHPAPPDPPRLLAAVLADPAFQAALASG